MKPVTNNNNSSVATAYLQKLGGNHNDPKTREAYERFKRPPYYMTANKKKESEEK